MSLIRILSCNKSPAWEALGYSQVASRCSSLLMLGHNGLNWADLMGRCILEGVKNSLKSSMIHITSPCDSTTQLQLFSPGEAPGHPYLNLSEHKPNRWCVLGVLLGLSPHHFFGTSPTTLWIQSVMNISTSVPGGV